MSLKIGIIGLPNVGKSSLFNLLTQSNVKVENFPFSTIKPNIGIVKVYDHRLDQLSNITKITSIIPSTIEFVDIAGLIHGSYQGNGLGNQFLGQIRETQALAQVVRCFNNDAVSHIFSNIQPIQDINIINTELALSDLEMCEKNIKKLKKKNNKNQSDFLQISYLKRFISHLDKFGELRSIVLNNSEKIYLNTLNFLTVKPIMYIANVDKKEYKIHSYVNRIQSISSIQKIQCIEICAISNLNNINVKKCKGNSITKDSDHISNLRKISQTAYKMLNLHTFFTINDQEIRAWNIPIGTSAIEAAKKIHTEFEKKFIFAKVISFSDFLFYEGEAKTKNAGKIQYKGKNYIIKDGDIIKFIIRN